MGVLLDVSAGRRVALPSRALIGRAATCAIVIGHRRASGEHAVLTWSGAAGGAAGGATAGATAGAAWELRDLGSTNGTWLDGQRVPAGQRRIVPAGAAIGAGASEPGLVLEDDAGPGAVACRLSDGALLTAAAGQLVLPGDAPCLLHQQADGAWLLDAGGETTALDDGAELEHGGVRWRFLVPPAIPDDVPSTLRAAAGVPTPAGLTLVFRVSRDEEQVELALRWDGGERALPSRAYHYLLVTLARRRLADAEAGLPRAEQGWIAFDALERALGYGRERINVEIHRARALLAEAGVPHAATLIERRAVSRELRIEAAALVVTRA